MTSSYSSSLRLELMATGDQSGTWGDTTNTNLGTLLEQAITGVLSLAMADANQTLTNLNGASDQARNAVIIATGALTAGRNIVVPAVNKLYLVRNSTTGGFSVTVKTPSGTGIAVIPGTARWVYCDGTNVNDGGIDLQTLTTSALSPTTTDGLALGTTSLMWSDLFLASGGVINWNNGTYTLTQSSTDLTSNGTLTAVSFRPGYTTTATAAGTTTLTVTSNYFQYFTGTTTQTVTMPVASTLVTGQTWMIVNNSTGAVTVQSSGANTIIVLAPGTAAYLTCILASGTSAASWQALYRGTITTSGKALSASNSLTLAGTDGTTMTFPATSSTVLTTGNNATITKGYYVTPYNIGTVSSGTTTPDAANGNYQYYTNNGAHTLAAPSSDCAIDILVTNGASAGTVTFSGFTVGSDIGSALTTTNTNKFIISIRRINAVATYSIYALQ